MLSKRIIPCLDIKDGRVVKGDAGVIGVGDVVVDHVVLHDVADRQHALGLADVDHHRLAHRAHVGHALDGVGALARAAEGRQEDADEQRDDADHDEQLDEREGASRAAVIRSIVTQDHRRPAV